MLFTNPANYRAVRRTGVDNRLSSAVVLFEKESRVQILEQRIRKSGLSSRVFFGRQVAQTTVSGKFDLHPVLLIQCGTRHVFLHLSFRRERHKVGEYTLNCATPEHLRILTPGCPKK